MDKLVGSGNIEKGVIMEEGEQQKQKMTPLQALEKTLLEYSKGNGGGGQTYSEMEFIMLVDRLTARVMAGVKASDEPAEESAILNRALVALIKSELYKMPAFLTLFHRLACKDVYALAFASYCRMGSQLMDLFLVFHGTSYLDASSMLLSLQAQGASDALILSMVKKHAGVLGAHAGPGSLFADERISLLVLESFLRQKNAVAKTAKAALLFDHTLYEFMDTFGFDLRTLANAYSDGFLRRRNMYYYGKYLDVKDAAQFAEVADFGKDSVLMLMPTSAYSDAVESALKKMGGKTDAADAASPENNGRAKLYELHRFQERRMEFVRAMLSEVKRSMRALSEQSLSLPDSLKLQVAMNSYEQILKEWCRDFQMYPMDDPLHEIAGDGAGAGGPSEGGEDGVQVQALEGAWPNMREALFEVFGVHDFDGKVGAVATHAHIFGHAGSGAKPKRIHSFGRYASTVSAAQQGRPFEVVLNEKNRAAVRTFARQAVGVLRSVMNYDGDNPKAPTFGLDIE